MKNVAVIDIGSNTIRLCVYSVGAKDFNLIAKKRSVAGLASYVDKSKNLKDEGIQKLIAVLNEFKEIYTPYRVDQVLLFATASLRLVKNSSAVVKRVKKETGLSVKVISGTDEAMYSFTGAMQCIDLKEGLLVDIGGASTELVYFKDKKIKKSYSFPMGSLNCYEKYVSRIIPSHIEQEKIKRDFLEFLDGTNIPDSAYGKPLCGVGGSARNAWKIYEGVYKNGTQRKMSYDNLKNLLWQFKGERKEYLETILRTAPHRIHTIIPGLIILKTIAKYFECEEIFISQLGIREGYLIKNAGNN